MMQKAFIIIRSRAVADAIWSARTARAPSGGAETRDFAFLNVKGIEQILSPATLKPANESLLSN